MLADITGLPAPTLKLPYWPILALAYANEFWASYITRKPPRMPLTAVQMARKFMYFDNGKALRELGLPQTPVRQALAEAVAWFREHGYV